MTAILDIQRLSSDLYSFVLRIEDPVLSCKPVDKRGMRIATGSYERAMEMGQVAAEKLGWTLEEA